MRKTMEDVKRDSLATHQKWMDEDTLRVWGTKLINAVYDGWKCWYFATFEDVGNHTGYTLRVQLEDGKIETVGSLFDYDNEDDATDAAHNIAMLSRIQMETLTDMPVFEDEDDDE